jgi:uncharacterized protein (TIGR03382 family)
MNRESAMNLAPDDPIESPRQSAQLEATPPANRTHPPSTPARRWAWRVLVVLGALLLAGPAGAFPPCWNPTEAYDPPFIRGPIWVEPPAMVVAPGETVNLNALRGASGFGFLLLRSESGATLEGATYRAGPIGGVVDVLSVIELCNIWQEGSVFIAVLPGPPPPAETGSGCSTAGPWGSAWALLGLAALWRSRRRRGARSPEAGSRSRTRFPWTNLRSLLGLALAVPLFSCHSGPSAMANGGPGASPCDQGSLTIRNSQDWKSLVDFGCTAISGDLTIAAPGLEGALVAPALRSVGGGLVIIGNTATTVALPALTSVGSLHVKGNAGLISIDLPALTTVGDLVVLSNTLLSSITLPALTNVGTVQLDFNAGLTSFALPALTAAGNLIVRGNTQLTSVALPALTTVGALVIMTNRALTGLVLPVLTTITGLQVYGNGAMTGIALPVLTTVGDLYVWWNTHLASLTMPQLTTVSGNLSFQGNDALSLVTMPGLTSVGGGLYITLTTGLVSCTFPALASIGGYLSVRNSGLTSLSLPALTTVGSLYVVNNTFLPGCLVVALKDRLVALGFAGSWAIDFNSAACPP